VQTRQMGTYKVFTCSSCYFLFVFSSTSPLLLFIPSWFWQTSASLENSMVAHCSARRIETAQTKSAWYTQVICGRWPFARATASPTSFGAHWYLRLSIHTEYEDFAMDMNLGSQLAYVWRVAKINGGSNNGNIIHPVWVSKRHSTKHNVACCITSENSSEAS
jgi:hypothetical protein